MGQKVFCPMLSLIVLCFAPCDPERTISPFSVSQPASGQSIFRFAARKRSVHFPFCGPFFQGL